MVRVAIPRAGANYLSAPNIDLFGSTPTRDIYKVVVKVNICNCIYVLEENEPLVPVLLEG